MNDFYLASKRLSPTVLVVGAAASWPVSYVAGQRRLGRRSKR
jgi:hypothetical protein